MRESSKSPLKKILSHNMSVKAEANSLSYSIINDTSKQSMPKQKKIVLEDFLLGKKLGEGRFGVVWVAFHKITGAIFALKKIAKSTIKSNFMIDQFIL